MSKHTKSSGMERDATPRDRFDNNNLNDLESRSSSSKSSKEIDEKIEEFKKEFELGGTDTSEKPNPYKNLRNKPLSSLNKEKVSEGYQHYYVLFLILMPLVVYVLSTNLDSFTTFVGSIAESLKYTYQKRNTIIRTLSTLQLVIFDLLCILVLLKKVRKNTSEELLKMRKYYVTLLQNKNSYGRINEDKKAYAVQLKIERIIAPKRRKFTNLLGEYIYCCVGPNLICVFNGLLIIKVNQFYEGTFTDKISPGEVFWTGLMAIQYSKMIIFFDTRIASKKCFDHFYTSTLLFTLVAYGCYLQKIMDICIISSNIDFGTVTNVIA